VNDGSTPGDTVKEKEGGYEPQKVIVKSTSGPSSQTFPRAQKPPTSETEAETIRSLRGPSGGGSSRPYDINEWTSTQHFHVPLGTQPRRATSRGALSVMSLETGSTASGLMQMGDDSISGWIHQSSSTRKHSGLSPGQQRRFSPVLSPESTLRRQVEPGERPLTKGGASCSMQHFHVPAERKRKLVYGRPANRTAMSQLLEQFRGSGVESRARSPSMNNEEVISAAHYPSGTLTRPENEGEKSAEWDTGSLDSKGEEDEKEEEEEEEEVDKKNTEDKRRRNEEELRKISTSGGIGKVFLDTIQRTENIKGKRKTNMDPRSAARTPSANKMPKYRLRYDTPAWASPSRDTHHGRPWDSEEDLEHQVVLTSSGCASGCNSDHIAPASATLSRGPPARSSSSLRRSVPSLYRSCVSVPRPGYTQTFRSQTLPQIRSVSGRIVNSELEMTVDTVDNSEFEAPPSPNPHSGVVNSVDNSFSWLTLAKYHGDSMQRPAVRSSYFSRPELKHSRTILDR